LASSLLAGHPLPSPDQRHLWMLERDREALNADDALLVLRRSLVVDAV
jgi:hypothetical protein